MDQDCCPARPVDLTPAAARPVEVSPGLPRLPFLRPVSRGTTDESPLSQAAVPVQPVQCRAPPSSGALRRAAALGAREEPGARPGAV